MITILIILMVLSGMAVLKQAFKILNKNNDQPPSDIKNGYFNRKFRR